MNLHAAIQTRKQQRHLNQFMIEMGPFCIFCHNSLYTWCVIVQQFTYVAWTLYEEKYTCSILESPFDTKFGNDDTANHCRLAVVRDTETLFRIWKKSTLLLHSRALKIASLEQI